VSPFEPYGGSAISNVAQFDRAVERTIALTEPGVNVNLVDCSHLQSWPSVKLFGVRVCTLLPLSGSGLHLQLYALIELVIERSNWDSPGIDYGLDFFWKNCTSRKMQRSEEPIHRSARCRWQIIELSGYQVVRYDHT